MERYVDPRKVEFARRLSAAMERKQLGVAELTRRIKALLPPSNRFGHAHIRSYRAALSIPKRPARTALCKVLGVREDEPIPSDEERSAARRIPVWATASGGTVNSPPSEKQAPYTKTQRSRLMLPDVVWGRSHRKRESNQTPRQT